MRMSSPAALAALPAVALALAACTMQSPRTSGAELESAAAPSPQPLAIAPAQLLGPMEAGALARDTGLRYEDLGSSVLLSGDNLRARFFPNNDKVSIDGQMLSMGEAARRDDGMLVVPPDGVRAVRRAVAAAQSRSVARFLRPSVVVAPPPSPLPTRVDSPVVPPRPTPAAPAPIQPGPGWVPSASENRWAWIVVHHSDDREGSCGKYDRVHRGKGWEGCGYHFVIGNGTLSGDGEVEPSDRWREQRIGAHTRVSPTDNHFNERGIGICLVGDFQNGGQPSAAQFQSLVRLTRWLMARYGISADHVLRHRDCKSTECPGKNFPWTAFQADIQNGTCASPP